MSTGLECEFFEPKPNQWYYALQDGSCPRVTWDWREFATSYGPFQSYDDACEHLRLNHANPGGHSVCDYTEFASLPELPKIYATLVEDAQSAHSRTY